MKGHLLFATYFSFMEIKHSIEVSHYRGGHKNGKREINKSWRGGGYPR